ncbi:MAG TPA: aminoacyl-tRNA hydrolase [Planctomycetota bacterium]|nr:aminoacyl-tRNA hydrolase [Planctomycetota bacterium]
MLRLAVGLGNPGDEYRETRHNVGFEVIDRVAEALGVRLSRFRGRSGQGKNLGVAVEDPERGFALLEPHTFMNVSGAAVAAAADRFGAEPKSILVVCDDFHLPLGRIRVRPLGSSGGHNGLKSIIAQLATEEFPRARIGIGEARGSAETFVLTRFRRDERPAIEHAIDAVASSVSRWCLDGDLGRLMNELNAPASEPPDGGGGGRGPEVRRGPSSP